MGKSTRKNPVATNPLASPAIQNPRAFLPRAEVPDFDDPYRPDEHRERGVVCSHCGAVYVNQHWRFDERQRAQLQAAGSIHPAICPGCKKIAERNPEGVVTLSGSYWPRHREEILSLIRNEEQRAMGINPLERVIDIREEGEGLIIETTNEKLARRLGRQMEKAHHGQVEYHWSDTDHLVRVYWQRDLPAG